MIDEGPRNRRSPGSLLLVAAAAAFCTYFCMYAFRKPFTSGTFKDQTAFGLGLKEVLVIAQTLGYMLSKFIGIRFVSGLRRDYRAFAIVGLILAAEAALVAFAYLPNDLKVVAMFVNGLPLGMVFSLVLSYLEGRRQTEALSAALCASFITSSGVVTSIGRWMVLDRSVSEFQMPMLVGLLFLPALFVLVWVLHRTPPPDDADREARRERSTMTRRERSDFIAAYWPGLSLLVFVFLALTIVRSVRDDFRVEIWAGLGRPDAAAEFAGTETAVALVVTALTGLTMLIRGNLAALRATNGMLCGAFLLVGASVFGCVSGALSPFAFMTLCGVGIYIPYVAFHTTVFERLIAASSRPANLGFLMNVADSIGYLGYVVVLLAKPFLAGRQGVLPFFLWMLGIVAAISIVALVAVVVYFERTLAHERRPMNAEELAAVS